MTESIHDDVEGALTAYGGSNFSYRTFGTFAIHPRIPAVIEPELPEAAPGDVASEPESQAGALVFAEAPPSLPAPAAPQSMLSPTRIEPAFGPLPVPPAPAPRVWEPAAAMAAAAEPVSPAPGYAPAHDPYFGPLPAPFLPGYPPPRPGADPRPHQPGQPLPQAPARRIGEMNIFQLAWDSPGAKADGGDRAGPRQAPKDAPLPGDEDLFRRI